MQQELDELAMECAVEITDRYYYPGSPDHDKETLINHKIILRHLPQSQQPGEVTDKERLDWLQNETLKRCIELSTQFDDMVMLHLNGLGFVENTTLHKLHFSSVRDAIDAAISQEKEGRK